MIKNKKNTTSSFIYYIASTYFFAFILVIFLQYSVYLEQITRHQFNEISQYIRYKLSFAKNYSYDSFKFLEYIDTINIADENLKYGLEINKIKKIYFLGKIYSYNNKKQTISFYGDNDENLSIKDLNVNPTILKCLDHKEKLNFGQIYLADRKANNFTIVACYASNKNQQVYLRLINFDELFKKVSMIFNFSNNYDGMIINRYEQPLYTSHNKHINNLDLNNITSLKNGLAKIKRYNTKFYSDTQGFNFKNYYSLTTFRENDFKIFIKQMSLSEEQEFYKFLIFHKYTLIAEFLIFLTLLLLIIKYISPLCRVASSMKKILTFNNIDNIPNKTDIWKLSIFSIIKLFESCYLKLRFEYKIVDLKYVFMEKLLKNLINNHTENNRHLLHNFNTPLHQIKLSLQALKDAKADINKVDKISIIEDALKHFESVFSANKVSPYRIELDEAYIDIRGIINSSLDLIFNPDIYKKLSVKKKYTNNNVLVLADEICLETIVVLLLSSSKNLIGNIDNVAVDIQTILTGLEVSIKLSGKKINKSNIEKYINCIDNKLNLNYMGEYDIDILIVNRLLDLLRFNMILETDNKESIKYDIIIPNIKLKS
ncbi:MAG: hypothetical protein K2P53_00730 [Rickettsiales bacterium]|nr:hypothetical protein [Burkholderiales bacterium]MBY0580197.1 hypothetical protein [Rickettsiales bacterium]